MPPKQVPNNIPGILYLSMVVVNRYMYGLHFISLMTYILSGKQNKPKGSFLRMILVYLW